MNFWLFVLAIALGQLLRDAILIALPRFRPGLVAPAASAVPCDDCCECHCTCEGKDRSEAGPRLVE